MSVYNFNVDFVYATLMLSEIFRVQLYFAYTNLPRIPLRGNHDNARRRRNYRIHPSGHEYIADYRPELNGKAEIFKGQEIVTAVLNGELELLSRSSVV